MEDQVLEVAISNLSFKSLEQIYEYGVETSALTAATVFIDELISHIENLSANYLSYPECRYLITKSKNIAI